MLRLANIIPLRNLWTVVFLRDRYWVRCCLQCMHHQSVLSVNHLDFIVISVLMTLRFMLTLRQILQIGDTKLKKYLSSVMIWMTKNRLKLNVRRVSGRLYYYFYSFSSVFQQSKQYFTDCVMQANLWKLGECYKVYQNSPTILR